MPYLSFLTICLLFGSNFYLMKLASSFYSPATIGAGRVLGGAAVLAALWRLTARQERIPRRLLIVAAIIGLVATGYPYAVQPWFISQGVEHSYLAMMVSLTPMSIMLISIPVLGIWPTTRQIIGVLIGLGFMVMLLTDGHHRGVSLWLLVLMVTVPLSYGVSNAFLKRDLSSVAALPTTTIMLLSAGAVISPFSLAGPSLGLGGPAEPAEWLTASIALAILGCLGTGVTMWLWVRLVNSQGPLFAGMSTYIVPVVALLWGIFDGERVTFVQLFAMAGILGSVALVQIGAATKSEPLPGPNQPNEPERLPCTEATH